MNVVLINDFLHENSASFYEARTYQMKSRNVLPVTYFPRPKKSIKTIIKKKPLSTIAPIGRDIPPREMTTHKEITEPGNENSL